MFHIVKITYILTRLKLYLSDMVTLLQYTRFNNLEGKC